MWILSHCTIKHVNKTNIVWCLKTTLIADAKLAIARIHKSSAGVIESNVELLANPASYPILVNSFLLLVYSSMAADLMY